MARPTHYCLAALLSGSCVFLGCTGELSLGTDAGPGVDSSIVIMIDGGPPPPGTDGGPPPDTDGGPPPGTDGGPPPEVDAGPPPGPCVGVSCGANASCSPATGECSCDSGFIDMGGSCVSIPPGDPAGRTMSEVCGQWNMGHVENASPAWTAGPGGCDPGTMSAEAIQDTLRRINMFRWLAGLPAVSHDASSHSDLMECAYMMDQNSSLSHSPPSSWTCYTAAGASAAGRSNIALGYRSPGAAIDGYMSDSRTPSLGHRRWIVGRRLGSVEIGFAGRGQCLGVFASGGSSSRLWTAYPNQGFAPIQTAMFTWSFHAEGLSLGSGSYAEVVRVSDGADMPVDSYLTGGGGPPPTVGFTPNGWTPAAGVTYRVTIFETSMGEVTYETTLVSC